MAKARKNTFEEYCPICWESVERAGKIDGKAVYKCPHCGMMTDRGKDNGHGKQLVGAINKL